MNEKIKDILSDNERLALIEASKVYQEMYEKANKEYDKAKIDNDKRYRDAIIEAEKKYYEIIRKMKQSKENIN
jgi:hypothetical protein